MKINKKFLFILLPIFAGIVLFDLLTKHFVAESVPYGEGFVLIPYLFNVTYVENGGAAWNMFSGNRVFLIIVSIIFIIMLCVFYFMERKNGVLFQVGCGLIFGGAIGNMVDRIFLGYVRDFIQFGFWKGFPVFNIADAALTIGVVLVILHFVISLVKGGVNARKNTDK